MILATAKIEDFDRFWETFSTKGAEKRKQYGSKGSHDVPAIFQEGGLQGRPEAAELARQHDA